ncbi:hypothetical protein C942_02059 [Photobacterium marinum]|uniref:Uncharacterized protein n=1 Tax=Photobacterium marinum TaxID=1056511 RepID=L8J832_9GAMM|nr:hypothetical protein C942_02059 [Photobacterium marinum]
MLCWYCLKLYEYCRSLLGIRLVNSQKKAASCNAIGSLSVSMRNGQYLFNDVVMN